MEIKAEETVRIECLPNIVAIQDTVELLSGKWRVAIMVTLVMRSKLCFKELKAELPFISAKVLASELRLLEFHKLIERTELPVKPLKVQYRMSDYGHTLNDTIFSLLGWGLQHRQVMLGKEALPYSISDHVGGLKESLPVHDH